MLDPGTRLGPYEIVSPLGAGGMGEVYRARDTRLGREVAIKVLPQHLSANPEVRARFEREAKTVSGLNHPNICTLFDVGVEDGTDYLVMELIEGETLAERLKKGPLPPADLLRLGAQIADALDRAHRAGVVHRDLKPGNVMLTRSGAKLMDFGLARATGLAPGASAGSGSGASIAAITQSPTVAQALTAEGTLIGTYQYMSPEQLEGKEADVRSDLWALGCVLYEMATGRRAFEGRSQASLIAAILEREPAPVGEPASGAPPSNGPPLGLDRLIRACLAKDPEERLQTAHDVKLQLQWIAESAGVSSVGAPVPPVALPAHAKPAHLRIAWAVAVLALIAASGAFLWLWPRATAPRAGYRFRTEVVPGVVDYFWPRVSPDGRLLVFQALDSTGAVRAWLRPLDQSESHPIAGTEGLQRAYWSPDGREIAFVAADKIQRVPIAGGTPVVVCAASGGADLSWGSKGQILMDGRNNDSLRVVPARGGELRPATRIDRSVHEIGSGWPCFLPDGEHFLYIGTDNSSVSGGNIRLGRIGSLDSKLLGSSDGRVEYAPGGWVVFLRGTTLLAQKLDLGAGKLIDQPITIAEDLRVGSSAGHFSISNSGTLAYGRGDHGAANIVQEADRTGRLVGGPLTSGNAVNPQLSPDGGRLLYQVSGQGQGKSDQIWVHDLKRGTDTKLTFTPDPAITPEWSPDGRRFACVVTPVGGTSRIMVGSADGLGAVDTVSLPGIGGAALAQWATANSRLVFGPGAFQGAFTMSPDSANHVPRQLAGLPSLVVNSTISPDGRWLAYATREGSMQPQVYVQSLVGAPGRWQISTVGGFRPQWTRGGQELLFESNGVVMAVQLDTKDSFHATTPVPVFTLPMATPSPFAFAWTCSADGQRFFVLVPPKQTSRGGIEVVTDFGTLVNRK